MNTFFEVIFLEGAFEFLEILETRHTAKILYNIRKAQVVHDPELFKKLDDEIWEFRTLFQGLQYRMLTFWDKDNPRETLVIATHGFIKKSSQVPENEIKKANQKRLTYFKDKGIKR